MERKALKIGMVRMQMNMVMDNEGSWSKQNLGLGTAHRVSLNKMCIRGLPSILETSLESNSNAEHRR